MGFYRINNYSNQNDSVNFNFPLKLLSKMLTSLSTEND